MAVLLQMAKEICSFKNNSNLTLPISSNDYKYSCLEPQINLNRQKSKSELRSYQNAPEHLKFNPYITDGYRGALSLWECVKSLFWWTNETVNIWSHLLGLGFFIGLTVLYCLGFIDAPTTHPWDGTVFTLVLICFQACMLSSAVYHIFSCHSESLYEHCLAGDLLGISLSILAIYVSGIYFLFSCNPFWMKFHMVAVSGIFVYIMGVQIMSYVSKEECNEKYNWHLVVFGGWAVYGLVPTIHWLCLHVGTQNEIVNVILPRIFGLYIISAIALFFYALRIPERFCPGFVNYFGSSHQIWHVLVFTSFYHWYNTGMICLEFNAMNPCQSEFLDQFSSLPTELEILTEL